MKEFDLEAAKAGKKVMTRNGMPARIICFDREEGAICCLRPLVVLVKTSTYEESVRLYDNCGHCSTHSCEDLVMDVEKKVYYVNIYENYDARLIYKQLFETYEEAYGYAVSEDSNIKYITTTKLEWEE